jgi:hypothetical protein
VFQPWIRGAADQPVAVPTSYRVKLRIVPYLITPTSVADEQKRRALLGTTDRGAVLRFDFMELYNLGYGAPVSCSSSNYNLIDSRVLTVMLPAAPGSGCWQAGAGRESDPSPHWPS